MNLLELLKEYRINKIDYEGYKLDIKLAKITDDLTEEDRQSEIEELKHKMDLVYKKIELVDKYNFEKIFSEQKIRLIKYIYFEGLKPIDVISKRKDIMYSNLGVVYKDLSTIRNKLKTINIM